MYCLCLAQITGFPLVRTFTFVICTCCYLYMQQFCIHNILACSLDRKFCSTLRYIALYHIDVWIYCPNYKLDNSLYSFLIHPPGRWKYTFITWKISTIKYNMVIKCLWNLIWFYMLQYVNYIYIYIFFFFIIQKSVFLCLYFLKCVPYTYWGVLGWIYVCMTWHVCPKMYYTYNLNSRNVGTFFTFE